MNEHEFSFNTEFKDDVEVEEMFDKLISLINDRETKDDCHAAIINPYQIQKVIYTYKVMKYITKGTKAKVSYELHVPYKSMGSVCVVGSDLKFQNTDWFTRAVELSSNFEVYPKTDGTVQMNFTFHGLTKTIE